MTASASACSIKGGGNMSTYEVALALDNTGSMSISDTTTGRSKMQSEIAAARNFVTQMFTNSSSTNMKISVVPFTTAVNVGTQNATAAWMDTRGQSSIHWENFPKLGTAASAYQQTAEAAIGSRFDMFTQVNQSWGGCVEERPQPYTLTDTAASSATPDTLFVPMFAPDESDSENTGYRSYNSYISDDGGVCAGADIYDSVDNGTASGAVTATFKDGTRFWSDGQQKLCKYLVKYAASNPTTQVQTATATTSISNWFKTNGYYCASGGRNDQSCLPAYSAQIVSNGNYSVSGQTLNFCLSNYPSQCTQQVCTAWSSSYHYNSNCTQWSTQNIGYNWTSTTLPANYALSPIGSSTSNSTVATSGYTAASTFTPWAGSGWNTGGNGWGTGAGWGWGGSTSTSSTNTCGFKTSTTNPGYTASGASSNLHIGSNQFALGGGANSGCDANLAPLQTLSSDQTALSTMIGKMTANGATNLVSGLLWAWRSISPNGPFNVNGSVKAYNTAGNHKVIVFMTDGYNNWEPDDSQNGGVYSSFGYYKNNRIGSLTLANGTTATVATAANNRAYLDAAFVQACANAKNAGVEIYTVAFSIPNAPIDAQGQTTLQSCATDASHYYLATDGNVLNTFFSSIGSKITQGTIRLKS